MAMTIQQYNKNISLLLVEEHLEINIKKFKGIKPLLQIHKIILMISIIDSIFQVILIEIGIEK